MLALLEIRKLDKKTIRKVQPKKIPNMKMSGREWFTYIMSILESY